ncbi:MULTISPECIES: YrzI family small protein [unclassified Sporolactobacillus]|uniref:YrzI family small protein n=1 Tax=unclassified Sporolactobacillus TaxID=2628533 RepID=UPI0023687F81|nr:YrzI family small protein [Sporolactobacillus sp. CQH2019]MDD9147889.1 YrzI family small protein [Sporolactobacillus sp. CQH2019]
MPAFLLKNGTYPAASVLMNQAIQKRGGGNRMLRLNFLDLTLTITVRRPPSVQQRYEDEQRIKMLMEQMLDRRIDYSRYYR